ncbi:YveK family protein [Nocardioides phosphati]|uniref:YveK family protein n=1 Tax=Nocardioides phosphati TaxID=1867775 RepID=UPI0016675911|nr:Wzz/FepE/Etk N-terminal domain-containing protein [Nocardioides phosphati]
MELRTYVGVLVRHWLLILLAMFLGVASAGAVLLLGAPRYTSTAKILFSASRVDTGQDLAYAGSYVQSRIQTYKGLTTSSAVLAPVIEDLGLKTTPRKLAREITVQTSQIDTLLGVKVESTHRREAVAIADAVASRLITEVLALENAGASAHDPGVRGVVVGPPALADAVSSRHVPVDLLIGLLLGAFVGVGAVTVRHLLRDPEPA